MHPRLLAERASEDIARVARPQTARLASPSPFRSPLPSGTKFHASPSQTPITAGLEMSQWIHRLRSISDADSPGRIDRYITPLSEEEQVRMRAALRSRVEGEWWPRHRTFQEAT